MSPEQMRAALIKGSAPSWQRRVEAMKDNQVSAIYQRKLAAGELNK
jgi:hypothetical protein